jgi:hypothetical protein
MIKNQTGAIRFDARPTNSAGEMTDWCPKSKRSAAHACHAINECRLKNSARFSHRLMSPVKNKSLRAIELRRSVSMRKFPYAAWFLPGGAADRSSASIEEK